MIYKMYIAYRITKYAKNGRLVIMRETSNQNESVCLIVAIKIW